MRGWHRPLFGLWLALLALDACAASTSVGPHASAKPLTIATSTTPSPAVKALVASFSPLRAPTGASLQVTGTLKVDASYIVASSQAALAPDGSAVVLPGGPPFSAQGGALVGNNGGGLISDHGSGVVSNNGSNMISNNGGSILGNAALVNDGGLGFITQTKLVSDAGQGLVSNNGAGAVQPYRLFAAATPVAGTSLPAAGMLVGVVSLVDGKPVSIGLDASGQPVYAAYTDARGRYQLYLPAALAGNVRLAALPPQASDSRLEYGLVFDPTKPAERSQAVDDAASLGSAFLRIQLSRFMALYMNHPQADDLAQLVANGSPAAVAPLFAGPIEGLRQDFEAAGYQKLSSAAHDVAYQRTADALIASADLSQVQVDLSTLSWKGPVEPALPAIVSLVHALDQGAAKLLAGDPGYFDARPYVRLLNMDRARQGLAPVHVVRADDLATIVLGSFFSSTSNHDLIKADEALVDVGLPETERYHLRAAAGGIYQALLAKLLLDPDTNARIPTWVAQAVAAASTTASPAPASVPVPAPTATPMAPVVTVATLAGDGVTGFADGAGAQARFSAPTYVAVEEHAGGTPTLYLADGPRIRRLVASNGGWVVSTLAGNGTAGHVDGPAASAEFAGATGLALDGQGHLFVAEGANHDVRMIDLLGADQAVTTIVGGPAAGALDGPGATASFGGLEGLAYSAPGRLAVADPDNKLIRAIDLTAPAHATTTLYAATGFNDHLASSQGLAFDPAGNLVVGSDALVKRIGTDGVPHLLAGSEYGGSQDGFWTEAGFGGLAGVAVDAAGESFVVDPVYGRVCQISPDGQVASLVHGTDGAPNTFADGDGTTARLNNPGGIAVDAAGVIYVVDRENKRLRSVTRR